MMRHATLLLLSLPLTLTAGATAQGPGTTERIAAALLEARFPAVDDPVAAPARILAAAGRDARSSMSELLVHLAAERADDVIDDFSFGAALDALEKTDLHPLAAMELRAARRRLAVRYDPNDWGRAAAEALAFDTRDAWPGFARRMLAVGPLGDSGGDFVHEPFAAMRRFPAPGATIAGRFGPVSPYPVERLVTADDIELRHPAAPGGGAFVALHQVRATEPVRGFVEVRCRGSFAIHVDGRRIGLVDRAAERRPDRVFLPVALPAGRHDVTVLTGDVGVSRLGLRYVDAAGATLATIEELDPATASDSGTAIATSPEVFDGRFQTGLDSLLDAAARPDASLAILAAAILEGFERGATDRALALLHAAEERLAAGDAAPDPVTRIGDCVDRAL